MDPTRTPRRHHAFARLFQRLALGIAALLISGCAIEGGVPNIAATPSPAPLGLPPTAAALTPTPAPTSWTIGLLDQPRTLLPYQSTPGNARAAAPISEIVFPSPVLSFNYSYTGTGVLERIPSLENGDAVINKSDVYLDDAGNITTTVTQIITQVDQLVVTFHWNPRLRWSDGQALTADDSVFAYEAAKAAPPSTDVRDRLAQIVKYERVDDHTTRATLQPDFTSPTYFLSYWTPLPRHLLASAPPDQVFGGDFARKPVGYGPYMIESRNDREIVLARNPHYFGSAPGAERVTLVFLPSPELMRAGLLNGNVDVASTDRPNDALLSALAKDPSSDIASSYMPNPNWEHIDFNLDVSLLQDVRVRHAIALGTNRGAMAQAIFGGKVPVLDSWVLPGQAESAPPDQITRYDFNPDEARKQLDDAGYLANDTGVRANSEGISLTLTLLTTENTPVRQQITRLFQQNMRDIGIEVQVQALPAEDLFSPDGPLFQRQFDMALFGWSASSDPGGLLLWSCAAIPSPDNNFSGDNFAGWCVRDGNRAIREAVTALDPEQRFAAYVRQQQLWTEALPVLPLFQRMTVVLATPGVRGLQPDPLAPITWNIVSWQRARP
jgi:peptide/nickel transport system substrate-binding protein